MATSVKGIITNIQRLTIHDGPGIRTTVFLKGCPLRCVWCDNPETWHEYPEIFFYDIRCVECGRCVKACPLGIVTMDKANKIDRAKCTLCMKCVEACLYGALQKVGEEVTAEYVVDEVAKDSLFYRNSGGGVTLSGGEPLYQPVFTAEIFKLCKEKFIHTTLDTSGYASREAVRQVLKYTDLVLFDIKHMDPEKHKKYTGVSNELILENAEFMADKVEIRIGIPLIPGFNDSEDNLKKTAEFAASIGVKWIDLMPIHKVGAQKYKFLGLEPPYSRWEKIPDEKVGEIRKLIESFGLRTTIGRSVL